MFVLLLFVYVCLVRRRVNAPEKPPRGSVKTFELRLRGVSKLSRFRDQFSIAIFRSAINTSYLNACLNAFACVSQLIAQLLDNDETIFSL